MGTKSIVSPSSQSITWDRTGYEPGLSTLKVTVTELGEPVLFAHFTIQFLGTSVEWLFAPGTIDGYPIIEDGTSDIPLELQNVSMLTAGTYIAKIYIDISNEVGVIRTLESTVYFTLTGSSSPVINTDAPSYSVIFNRANNNISGNIDVGILNNTDSKLLSFWQPSTIFEPKTGFTSGFTLEDNTTSPMLLNSALPESGTVTHLCRILGPIGEFITNFTVNLLILNVNGIGVNPTSLSFEVIKNTSEKTAVLNIVNPLGLDFTIETPDWLTASVLSGNTSLGIDITTETSSLNANTYNGIIKILFDGGFIDVPVQLILKQFITIDASPYNFCLDIPPLLFTKINELARYVKVTLSAKYKVMGVETVFNQDFAIPYIDNRAWFELGKKLHNYFPRFRNHLFDISAPTEFLKAINCDLILEELNVDYESLLSENLNGLKFFPGSEPEIFPILTNFGFRKKNKGTILFITHADGDQFLTEKITDTSLIDEVTHDAKSVKLYEYPAVYSPIHMQWENQNLVPEWFTFTGEYSINSDFSHISSKNVLNSLMEKFETSKIKKLSINSGFILKEEIKMIEEMIESKIAFIKIDEQIFHCYNVTPKMVVANSIEMIIERDLEFIIVEH